MRGLSLVAASGGHSSSRCAGLSLSWPLLLRSTGSRCAGSVIVAHGLSCSAACGIFPDQGSNPCALHWQADSQPLHHQRSPREFFCHYLFKPFFWAFFLMFFETPVTYILEYLTLVHRWLILCSFFFSLFSRSSLAWIILLINLQTCWILLPFHIWYLI